MIQFSTLTSYLSCLFLVVLMSSCSVREELWIEKDGSGKYEMMIDMGRLLPMIAMMDTTGALDNSEITDTIVNFSSLTASDSLDISKVDRPDLLEKMNVKTHVDIEKDIMVVGILLDFDNLDQITEIFKEVSKIENLKTTKDENPASMDQILDFVNEDGVGFSWKKGYLSRSEQIFDEDDASEIGAESTNPEELAMMKSMFGNMEIKTIIHLPGKVKKISTNEGVLEDKNTVVFTYDLFEIMENGKYGAFEIEYK